MNFFLFRGLIEAALREDRADLDLTTLATVRAEAKGRGRIIARQSGVIAGLPLACEVFALLDGGLACEQFAADGVRVPAGAVLAEVKGPLRPMLTGERTALNFLQHLSGVATATAALADLIRDLPARILDTRKTTPGFRYLEKYAVMMGGGANHRFSLAEMILIKDNHLRAAGGVAKAVELARQKAPPYARIEVECETEAQVREALAAGADLIMLDNMSPEEMGRMVRLVGGRAKLEASGNITAGNIRSVAATGVDFISVGALTHSAPALDVAMEITAD
ncbi:MAG: carboxylating nicotinate-nucleotide diphosphorylase [Patescibacteria group bacterium]